MPTTWSSLLSWTQRRSVQIRPHQDMLPMKELGVMKKQTADCFCFGSTFDWFQSVSKLSGCLTKYMLSFSPLKPLSHQLHFWMVSECFKIVRMFDAMMFDKIYVKFFAVEAALTSAPLLAAAAGLQTTGGCLRSFHSVALICTRSVHICTMRCKGLTLPTKVQKVELSWPRY